MTKVVTDEALATWFLVNNKSDGQFPSNTNDWYYWGFCSANINGKGYQCARELKHEALGLTYDLNSVNMAVKDDIDNFLLDKLRQWKCNN
jgi:hypothetical protein